MRTIKHLMIGAAAMFIIAAGTAAVPAQRPTRITFTRGTSSKVVTGTLSSYKQKRVFVIRVKAGQEMRIENVGRNYISIWVKGPARSGYEQDMAADCHSNIEVSPTAEGNYTLTVQECEKADRWRGTFRFKVTVR